MDLACRHRVLHLLMVSMGMVVDFGCIQRCNPNMTPVGLRLKMTSLNMLALNLPLLGLWESMKGLRVMGLELGARPCVPACFA